MEDLFNKGESFLDKAIKEMGERGYELVEKDGLAETKFNSKTATFDEVLVRTEDDIKNNPRYTANGLYEVELVLQPNQKIEDMISRKIMTREEASELTPPETDKSFLVFRKKIK